MAKTFADSLFEGKRFLITGGTSGLGLGVGRFLRQLGAFIVLSGRDQEALAKIQSEFGDSNCGVQSADLSSFDASHDFAENVIENYGPFDGYFHSAGESVIKPLRLLRETDVEKAFNAATIAPLAICSALARAGAMKSSGSSIVLMSSISSIAGRQGMVAYSASRAAINGLVRSAAIELAQKNIRVNAILAGAVLTEMHSKIKQSSTSSSMSDYEQRHPLGFGEVQDIANVVAFLLSDGAKWVTGTCLTIDGGYTA